MRERSDGQGWTQREAGLPNEANWCVNWLRLRGLGRRGGCGGGFRGGLGFGRGSGFGLRFGFGLPNEANLLASG
jgi:hypothetical protein